MERVKKFTAGPAEAGLRVDRAVLLHVDGVSRARLQECIEQQLLTVNGLPVKPSARLKPGDKVVLRLAPRPAPDLAPQDLPLNILYEDAHLIVLDKPAGLVVHPGAGVADGTLANALIHRFGELPGRQLLRPGIIHRLDKETSGLLLVTRTEESMLKLSEMFQRRTVYKEYLALVHGAMESRHGVIEKPIGRHPVHRMKMTTHAPRSRPSKTEWFVEKEFAGFTLLRVVLHTGRTHQIRVHLASVGRPVVGDALYGGGRDQQVRFPRARQAIAGLGRFFLHAHRLRFHHPWRQETVEFTAPLPPELVNLLAQLAETAPPPRRRGRP